MPNIQPICLQIWFSSKPWRQNSGKFPFFLFPQLIVWCWNTVTASWMTKWMNECILRTDKISACRKPPKCHAHPFPAIRPYFPNSIISELSFLRCEHDSINVTSLRSVDSFHKWADNVVKPERFQISFPAVRPNLPVQTPPCFLQYSLHTVNWRPINTVQWACHPLIWMPTFPALAFCPIYSFPYDEPPTTTSSSRNILLEPFQIHVRISFVHS